MTTPTGRGDQWDVAIQAGRDAFEEADQHVWCGVGASPLDQALILAITTFTTGGHVDELRALQLTYRETREMFDRLQDRWNLLNLAVASALEHLDWGRPIQAEAVLHDALSAVSRPPEDGKRTDPEET